MKKENLDQVNKRTFEIQGIAPKSRSEKWEKEEQSSHTVKKT
jgi:hypothetical protein